MNSTFKLILLGVVTSAFIAVADDATKVSPPETKLVTPTALVTAEAFNRPESLAPKGQPGWRGGIGEWRVEGGVLHAKDSRSAEVFRA